MRSRSLTNFLKGASSIFDLFPSEAYETEQSVYVQIGGQRIKFRIYNSSLADYVALRNDWIMVGDSLRLAIVKLTQEENLERKEEEELIFAAEEIATGESY